MPALTPDGFLTYSAEEVDRWNREWLTNYLIREFREQLMSYAAFPHRPALPEDPLQVLKFDLGSGWQSMLKLFCHGSALEGKAVFEIGCGCGNLGKLIGRYVESYLGVDCSEVALAIARLVSPPNCIYLHANDHAELRRYRGTIDTIVGRWFWIHQNFESAQRLLRFLVPFLKADGRLYFDFFRSGTSAEESTWITLPARSPASEHASAMYEYSDDDVRDLLEAASLRVELEAVPELAQRRYIVARRV